MATKSTTKKASKKKAPLRLEDPDKMKTQYVRPKAVGTAKDRDQVLRKMVENVRNSVDLLHERSKLRPVRLFTPGQLSKGVVPYDEILFQNMLRCVGFRAPLAIEIITQEDIGSTTFVMDWMSRLVDLGCYCIYCECEGKQMDPKRIKRLMDKAPDTAVLKMNAIEWTSALSRTEFDNTLRQTVKDMRKRCDASAATKGKPIFFFGDPWSALMSEAEAEGNYDWGLSADAAKKQTPKDTTSGSNFDHAKHAQGMARWLPAFMKEHNCVVVFINKQNDKVDFNSKLPSYMQPGPAKNDTRIGGRALKRLCGYRATLIHMRDRRLPSGEKTLYGHDLRMTLVKNNYGAKWRDCEMTVLYDLFDDKPGYQSPGFTFDLATAAWMSKNSILGTKVKDGLYTCDALGCVAVSPAELIAAFKARPDEVEHLGAVLNIEGFNRPVEDKPPVEDEEGNEEVALPEGPDVDLPPTPEEPVEDENIPE